MSKKQPHTTPRQQQGNKSILAIRWPQLVIIGGVVLAVVLILVLKDRPTGQAVSAESGAALATTLPEAAGQTLATVEMTEATSQHTTVIAPDESPEEKLDRLLAAGQPMLAFFHSNNCVQCVKMMEVVDQVYPEFQGAVELVDVDVYDQENDNLLQRANIRVIPTQAFIDRSGKGQVVLGLMTADELRAQLRALEGKQ